MKSNHAVFIGMISGAVACLGLLACSQSSSDPHSPDTQNQSKEQAVGDASPSGEAFAWPDSPSDIIELEFPDYGTIRIGLYAQVAPKTVAHFLDLAERGIYDQTRFHRVIEDFMIQGGDPYSRKLGPDESRKDWGSLSIEDEYNFAAQLRGVISMANRGKPDTAASQFFILHKDTKHLSGNYTAFGQVIDGIGVVDKIATTETDKFGRWGEKGTPLSPVILSRVVVEEVGDVEELEEAVAGAETEAGSAVELASQKHPGK
jgi:peptidyl-prolyl cis-trans isomerase B (cyclophilin B)